jgi:transcription initiation factor TFIIE subunit alpha
MGLGRLKKEMKLSNKVIEAVVSEVAGEDVIPLVKALKNKKNVSEFKLAEDIKHEINITRNMLYRLHNANLVSFIRKKDKQKGWYIYYWTFNPKMVKYLASNLKEKRLEKLKERIKREKSGDFFTCENQCVRLDFEQSTEFQFKCPECGELLNQEDNREKIKELEKEIKRLEKELKKKK